MNNKRTAEQSEWNKNISQVLETDRLDSLKEGIEGGHLGPDESINSFDHTPLMLSVRAGSLECARFLLEIGADVTLQDHLDRTALRYAAHAGQPEAVDLLLEAGAGVDVSDQGGKTPLMEAALTGSLSCTKKLIEVGADPEAYGQYRGECT